MKILGILFAMFFVIAQTVWADTAVVSISEDGKLEQITVIRGKTFDKEVVTTSEYGTVELLTNDGTVIGKTKIDKKMFLLSDRLSGKKLTGTIKEIKARTVILPWKDIASSIRITKGKEPQNVLKINKSTIGYKQVIAQTKGAGGGYGRLNILHLGAGYTGQNSLFNSDSASMEAFVKSHFDGYNRIASFGRYNPNSTLGCPMYGEVYLCNANQVLTAAEQSGQNYDEIYIIINQPAVSYGASGFVSYDYKTTPWLTYSHGSNHPNTKGNVETHELGHSVGALCDEYPYRPNTENPSHVCVNCRKSNNLCPKLSFWYPTVGCNSCYTTCKSGAHSVMGNSFNGYYNDISKSAGWCYPHGLMVRIMWFETH